MVMTCWVGNERACCWAGAGAVAGSCVNGVNEFYHQCAPQHSTLSV